MSDRNRLPICAGSLVSAGLLGLSLTACNSGGGTAASSPPTTVYSTHQSASSTTVLSTSASSSTTTGSTTSTSSSTTTTTVSTSAAALPLLPIHLPGFPVYAVFKPASVSYSADVNSVIDHLVWTVWDSTHAIANGQHVVDDCIPNCAQGKITRQPVVLTLRLPVAGLFTSVSETRGGRTTTLTGDYVLQGALPESAKRPLPGGTSSSSTSPRTSSSTTPRATSTTTAAGGCPSPATLLALWRASNPYTTVTKIVNVSCWSHWVVGFAVGEGNGSVKYKTTPTLHVTGEAEGVQFRKEVCGTTASPLQWRTNESILRC